MAEITTDLSVFALFPEILSQGVDGQGRFTFIWTSQVGTQYQVQSTETLETKNWQDVGQPVPASSETSSFTDESGTGGPGRYYRVLMLDPTGN